MFTSIEPLREPLLAARLLREDVLATPVLPGDRPRLARWLSARSGAAWPALELAARTGSALDSAEVRRDALQAIAEAAGGGAWRSRPGVPFHGQAAPAPAGVRALLDEVLETVNGPKAIEGWSPVLRAVALHFLVRLVQPFAAPPEVLGPACEALVLASDGFDARRMLLGAPDAVAEGREGRTDPDGFARARADALVDALGETRDVLRAASARAVLAAWAAGRDAGLNPRQRSVLEWLSEGDRSLEFDEYAGLHGGRAAPSLRSLQRDWKGLRDGGWLVAGDDGRWRLSVEPLEWGAGVSPPSG